MIDFSKFPTIFKQILLPAINETLYMSLVSTLIATIFGILIAVALIVTGKDGLRPNRAIYITLDMLVNAVRSFPFIILIIALFPFTKFVVGTKLGTNAAMVPLVIAAAPFIARLVENAFKDVDKGVIEAAKSFGSSNFQIIFRVMIPEALPNIINSVTIALIGIIGYSAMAGMVGGGGLGAVAVNHGYLRFRPDIMLYTVVILVIMIQIFQSVGDYLYKITKK